MVLIAIDSGDPSNLTDFHHGLLSLKLSPLMLIVIEWWRSRSRIALAITVSPKTSPQAPRLWLLLGINRRLELEIEALQRLLVRKARHRNPHLMVLVSFCIDLAGQQLIEEVGAGSVNLKEGMAVRPARFS